MLALMDEKEKVEAGAEASKEIPLRWYDIADVVKITSLGETFLRDEMAAGRLRSIKVGRARRISERDLRAWMAQYDPSANEV